MGGGWGRIYACVVSGVGTVMTPDRVAGVRRPFARARAGYNEFVYDFGSEERVQRGRSVHCSKDLRDGLPQRVSPGSEST